ncbi:MAG TPA: flagellar FliJ family protein [Candidatus Ozemobacteraceae bacterium]|nr:flagellar FliJ family protein [Candidatus Ozemobacteraceae bacterium]HQG29787.1 flagellar FliJ family protein [Candidatus Ozemobacteraceae bacterium]
MAFRFRFQQLLNIAIHDEDAVKARLAVKDGQIAEAEAQIQKYIDEYNIGLEAKAIDLLAGRMDQVRMYPLFLARLANARSFYEEERDRLMEQRAKIVVELNEKRRVRKTYERILERDRKRYVTREQKLEQKRLDDFASRLGRLKSGEEANEPAVPANPGQEG